MSLKIPRRDSLRRISEVELAPVKFLTEVSMFGKLIVVAVLTVALVVMNMAAYAVPLEVNIAASGGRPTRTMPPDRLTPRRKRRLVIIGSYYLPIGARCQSAVL
jgi:hypothetical protein